MHNANKSIFFVVTKINNASQDSAKDALQGRSEDASQDLS
jgi:hypothetical protein